MTDYIERDLLREILINTPFYPRCEMTPDLLTSVQDRLNDTLEIIDNFPAAEVRPVVRGEWVETEMYYDDYAWICSVCGEPWTLVEGTPSENNMNYCPNCGAEMVTGCNQLEEDEG